MTNQSVFGSGSRLVYDVLMNSENREFLYQGMSALLSGAGFSGSFTTYGLRSRSTARHCRRAPQSSVPLPRCGRSVVVAFDPWSLVIAVVIYVILSMMSCNEDEGKLAMKEGAKLCHTIGTYCSSCLRVLGVCVSCVEHTTSKCCFNSMLARIVNEQGRVQVGKGWGGRRAPDCSGFTVAQLQSLDFAAMDLPSSMPRWCRPVRTWPRCRPTARPASRPATTAKGGVSEVHSRPRGHRLAPGRRRAGRFNPGAGRRRPLLLISAIDSPTGQAQGVLTGQIANRDHGALQGSGPILIDVTTERRYRQPGCSRLKLSFSQDGVNLPGASGTEPQDRRHRHELLPRRHTPEVAFVRCLMRTLLRRPCHRLVAHPALSQQQGADTAVSSASAAPAGSIFWGDTGAAGISTRNRNPR